MSLQSIMDATPIVSWGDWKFGEHIGSSHKYTYLISKQPHEFELWWGHKDWEKSKKFYSVSAQEIIDKINELEGIK